MSGFNKFSFKEIYLAELKKQCFFIHSSGPIAQLVEQLTFNQLVPRSSRGRPTIFSIMLIMYATLSGSSVISLKTLFLMSSFNKFPFKEIYLAELKKQCFFIHSSGPIAQLVEQLTFNQLVPRSSRGRPTIFRKAQSFNDWAFFYALFILVKL